MRVPQFERYQRSLIGTGFFLVGFIVGCAVFMSIYQNNFSLLSIQNKQMRSEIKNLQSDNQKNNLKQKKSTQSILASIKIIIESKTESSQLDEISINELSQKISKDLAFLKGKKIQRIGEDPLLYRNLIDGKTYHAVRERDYTVHVRTLIMIDDELTLSVTAVSVRL